MTRKNVAVFPNVGKANWILVGPIASSIDDPTQFRNALRKLRSSERWRVAFDAHGVTVFQRR